MLTLFNSVVKALRERHDRQMAIRELSQLNDHQLADIGVDRGSLVDAVYHGRTDRVVSR